MKVFSRRLVLSCLLIFLTGQPGQSKPAKMLDLSDTVATNRILTRLASILQASDLGTFLSSRGPFTLFAPTDSAFSKLPPGMLDYLLRPENKEQLQRLLLFHVVNGKRMAAKDLLPLKTLPSCEGSTLPIKVSRAGTQSVDKAKILHADIKCLNGVIHEIDTVLVPPDSPLPKEIPPPAPPAPVMTNAASSEPAITATNTPSTHQGPVVVPAMEPATTNASPVAPAIR